MSQFECCVRHLTPGVLHLKFEKIISRSKKMIVLVDEETVKQAAVYLAFFYLCAGLAQ